MSLETDALGMHANEGEEVTLIVKDVYQPSGGRRSVTAKMSV